MSLNFVSLNTLRAFAAAAKHLNFTNAAKDLFVTQAAISHQVKALEAQIGFVLFRRTTRGLVLTDEGHALAPVVRQSLEKIEDTIAQIQRHDPVQVLTLSVIGTFALGHLVERLADFRASYPKIDLRLMTNNNKVDMWAESLDYAIKYGDGAWRAVHAQRIMFAPISPLCSPQVARRLWAVEALSGEQLLRSYRATDWPDWLALSGAKNVHANGAIFDTSTTMIQAAILGEGVALAPPAMFQREIASGQLVQPFEIELDAGSYWLTRLLSKEETPAMLAFKAWLMAGVVAQ